ncbi:Zn-dependent hydrolase, glyoxylase [Mycolicibacterium phlei]|jgi:rhodanese-related sulfurtransferase|uniref:Sulfide dehydrogenase n=1 Tax=Mycolicibacterium phlei DSM 43239 = CCUG 21000 TaxID=1226750 RepID=A0A5N5UVR6_MYCPH|nr:rhodanese-like domain-containing protein [Mycolicibacterium phlei]VEG09298.1 Zn-dependent hydrolase, glyoxylase [Mycobacteroides chelonae]AMO61183.1 Thiosulfate sulfurtransferase GlpE [Mycolicibacterium phlei]KAB7752569.1 sulfide dehydrogenase [Mycolicibacterium phlei DSM 43239 = CCUG 21000]KXW60920.1 sulfide dehydrogenase [Mycolicibacterium phlei DSM 43239 = CCUG 21000]KXW61394.1 sulfide dehydrogenase [Mycolicibacterium phlei DSM 43070]
MGKTAKDLVAAANTVVPKISPERARELIAAGALVVDVREGPELEQTGRVAGALHVPRGMLEFRADPESPYYDDHFVRDRPVIVYCASGGRSALSGQALKELGYQQVYNLGAFGDWADSGGPVEKA